MDPDQSTQCFLGLNKWCVSLQSKKKFHEEQWRCRIYQGASFPTYHCPAHTQVYSISVQNPKSPCASSLGTSNFGGRVNGDSSISSPTHVHRTGTVGLQVWQSSDWFYQIIHQQRWPLMPSSDAAWSLYQEWVNWVDLETRSLDSHPAAAIPLSTCASISSSIECAYKP